MSMEHLPQELVFNVLSRLPARFLVNCKCVCKSWFHIITDPQFVTNYYSVYNNPTLEKHLLVIQRPSNSRIETCIYVLSWKNFNFNEHKRLNSSQVLTPNDEFNFKDNYWAEIMGPCNGIYFLEGNPNVMMNPSLRQFKVLPESHLTVSHATHAAFYSCRYYTGFGFDPKTNDYKVVVLKGFFWRKEAYERESGHWRVELYSLNSNSWRKLDYDDALLLSLNLLISTSRVYTYAKNCYHWRGYADDKYGKTREIILAFDMVTELFRKIKVPKTCSSSQEHLSYLAPFNDSDTIAVIVVVGGTMICFDVWVMKDYWDEGSWIKQYSVGPIQGFFSFLGFYGNNRFLWIDNNDNLVLYKADCEDKRDFQVDGVWTSVRTTRYMESLISLHMGNEESRHQCFSMSLVPNALLTQRE